MITDSSFLHNIYENAHVSSSGYMYDHTYSLDPVIDGMIIIYNPYNEHANHLGNIAKRYQSPWLF